MYTTITSDGYTDSKLLLSLFIVQYNDIHSYIIKPIVYICYLQYSHMQCLVVKSKQYWLFLGQGSYYPTLRFFTLIFRQVAHNYASKLNFITRYSGSIGATIPSHDCFSSNALAQYSFFFLFVVDSFPTSALASFLLSLISLSMIQTHLHTKVIYVHTEPLEFQI